MNFWVYRVKLGFYYIYWKVQYVFKSIFSLVVMLFYFIHFYQKIGFKSALGSFALRILQQPLEYSLKEGGRATLHNDAYKSWGSPDCLYFNILSYIITIKVKLIVLILLFVFLDSTSAQFYHSIRKIIVVIWPAIIFH